MDWYVGTEWKFESKGLRKQVLSIDFKKLEKPHQVSKVIVRVHEVEDLNGRASKYLSVDNLEKDQELEMGTALTPVDYYIEMFVQQMIIGERSRCFITTNAQQPNNVINFIISLEKIITTKPLYALAAKEIYQLALCYKDNGVKMFKDYTLFAHDYFSRAAKCLISYKPFENLKSSRDGIHGNKMNELFLQLQTNLAAALLKQQRYEDVIYQTDFVDAIEKPNEKSIYRRATAFYHLKEFEKAIRAIQKIPNYKDKSDFSTLEHKIQESQKCSDAHYKNIVQRMFK